MVETPLRRSRRVQSQSDDEASVASGSRSASVRTSALQQSAASAGTPTRRGTRARRTSTKGGKVPASATKKELEAIPESIANAPAVDGDVDSAVAAATATPAKSAKKKKRKSPKADSKVGEKQKVEDTKEDTKVATASPKSAKKSKKKVATPAGDSKEVSDTKEETNVATPCGSAATPSKSSSKKKKKKGSTPAGDPKVAEHQQVEGAKDESKVATPSKSSKKKKRKSLTPDKNHAEATKEETKVAATPSNPAEKKKRKSLTPDKNQVEVTEEETKVAATPSKSAKKKKRKNSLTPEKNQVEVTKTDAATDGSVGVDAAVAETPVKSAKKKKKKKGSTEGDPKKEPTPPASASSGVGKNALKKKHNKEPTDGADTPTSEVMEGAAASPSSTVKKAKENKKKSSKKEVKGGDDKSPTKKPHKKQQTHKHAKPAVVSASPKRKPQRSKKAPSSPMKKSHSGASPPKHVMDVKVHRMRFLKLAPKSIKSMVSTPSDSSATSGPQPVRLAVSREGGSVELLSPQDRWVAVGNIPGVRGREVDALVWVCGQGGKKVDDGKVDSPPVSHRTRQADEQRHLFGCSRDGTIFELDFGTKRQKGVIGSGGGGVFCLASMCSRGKCCCCSSTKGSRAGSSCGGYFAAGCEDGTVKIYTAFGIDGGENVSGMPQLVATLPSAGNAILSLAWVPGHSGNDDGGMGGSVIFAGVADGTIRRFDCATSVVTGPISTGSVLAPSRGSASISYRWKSTLRMTVENRGFRESTKVWALEALSDGTVITGDSLGHVQIWDGMSGTMTQTFDHNENGADVLCLAVSEDENKIFASGIDSSVRCIQRQSSPPTAGKVQNVKLEPAPVRKWISSISHRKHSHDVKALAICHKQTSTNSKSLELLVSGSVDTRICTYITKDFKSSRPKIWYNWPSLSPISASRKQRLLSVTRDNRIDLYRLNSQDMADPLKIMNPETRDDTKCLVKTISIQSPFNLSCSVISDDGKFLAASDAVSLYVFALEVEDEDGMFDVRPTKLNLSGECKHPATALKFDDSGRLICATNNGPINILKISSVSETGTYKVSLEHVFKEHTVDWSASSHHFPVVSLDLSSDGKWLAAGRFSSGKGAVNIFTLPTNNDDDGRYQHWWSTPEMDAPTTCIKFLGGGSSVESSLAVGCSNNEFYIYNLGRRSLSHWSNDMGLPLKKSLPKELTSRSEPVTRIVSNPVAPQRFILGSHGFYCVVDLDQPVPERSNMFPPDHLRAQRLQHIKDDDSMMYGPPPNKKSKGSSSPNASTNFTICLRHSEILFQDFIAENEMVIVEEPWMSILEELPDALARRVYGT